MLFLSAIWDFLCPISLSWQTWTLLFPIVIAIGDLLSLLLWVPCVKAYTNSLYTHQHTHISNLWSTIIVLLLSIFFRISLVGHTETKINLCGTIVPIVSVPCKSFPGFNVFECFYFLCYWILSYLGLAHLICTRWQPMSFQTITANWGSIVPPL